MDDSRLNGIEYDIRKASIDYDYNTTEYSISTIVNKYKIGKIFGPYYHHQNAVLGNERKSKYIESILLGMPIIPIVACLWKEERQLETIDGSQRIQALVDYCLGKLKLCGLEILKSLNGTIISDLPTLEKDKFLARCIKFHLMGSKGQDIHADIYFRYNAIQN